MRPELREYLEVKAATEVDKIDSLSLEELRSYHRRMYKVLPKLHDSKTEAVGWRRVGELSQKIAAKEAEERSERHHRESISLGRWTLWTAVAAVVVPGIVTVVFHILSHKSQPSKTDVESSQSFPQTPAPTSVSQELEANSSSATPSPEQKATTTPSLSTPTP